MNWGFDAVDPYEPSDGGISLCLMGGYMLKPNQEIYLGVGPDIVRIGGRFYRSKGAEQEKGLYFSVEFDAPLDSTYVDSFGSFGVGYSF